LIEHYNKPPKESWERAITHILNGRTVTGEILLDNEFFNSGLGSLARRGENLTRRIEEGGLESLVKTPAKVPGASKVAAASKIPKASKLPQGSASKQIMDALAKKASGEAGQVSVKTASRLAGAVGGGIAGGSQGKTPKERVINAFLGAAAGGIVVASLQRLARAGELSHTLDGTKFNPNQTLLTSVDLFGGDNFKKIVLEQFGKTVADMSIAEKRGSLAAAMRAARTSKATLTANIERLTHGEKHSVKELTDVEYEELFNGMVRQSAERANLALVSEPSGVKKIARNVAMSVDYVLREDIKTPESVKLAEQFQTVVENTQLSTGKEIARLQKATKPLSKAEQTNFVDVLDGVAKPMSAKVADAVKLERARLDKTADTWIELGGKVKNKFGNLTPFQKREDYFPHIVDWDRVNAALEEMKADAGELKIKGGKLKRLAVAAELKTRLRARSDAKAIIEHLIKTKQAESRGDALHILDRFIKENKVRRAGNIEYTRELDLPKDFLERDPTKALAIYYHDAFRRMEEVKLFGHGYEKAAETIATMPSSADIDFANRAFKRFVGIDQSAGDEGRFLAKFKNWNVVRYLGLAQIMNYGQRANVPLRTGYLRDFFDVFTVGGLKGRREAEEAGATIETTMREILGSYGASGRLATGFLKWTGMNLVETGNRIASNRVGIKYTLRQFGKLQQALIKGNLKLANQMKSDLAKLGVDAERAVVRGSITDQELRRAGLRIANETQFTGQVNMLPVSWSTTYGRFFTQFKVFAFQQAKFVKEQMFVPGTRIPRNPKAWAVFLLIYPEMGEVVGDIRNFAKTGVFDPGEPGSTLVSTALGAAGVRRPARDKRREGFIARYVKGKKLLGTNIPMDKGAFDLVVKRIDNIGWLGAWGVASDAGSQIVNGQLPSAVVGPTLGHVNDLLHALAQGNSKELVKEIPVVGQSKFLQRKVLGALGGTPAGAAELPSLDQQTQTILHLEGSSGRKFIEWEDSKHKIHHRFGNPPQGWRVPAGATYNLAGGRVVGASEYNKAPLQVDISNSSEFKNQVASTNKSLTSAFKRVTGQDLSSIRPEFQLLALSIRWNTETDFPKLWREMVKDNPDPRVIWKESSTVTKKGTPLRARRERLFQFLGLSSF